MESGKVESEKMEERRHADELLAEIAAAKETIEKIEAEAEVWIKNIREKYAPDIEAFRAIFLRAEHELVRLMRQNGSAIFEGEDTVRLLNGLLLHGEEKKVKIPRDALDAIKALGWREAIKVAESVDRGVLETWPEERLFAIGAERKLKETWSYEIKVESGK